MDNILACDHAHEAWMELEVANRYQGFKTMLAARRKLCHTTAEEGDNIIEHLDKLDRYHRETNVAAMGDKRFEISDFSFNLIIAQSLPPSWDHVTSYFVDVRTGQTLTDVDPRTMINSQQFMISLSKSIDGVNSGTPKT
jgi:LTR polyprotein gag-polypeptide-like protein